MALRHVLLNEALKSTETAARTAKDVVTVKSMTGVANTGVIKELAAMCGRAGVSGAVVEGSMLSLIHI